MAWNQSSGPVKPVSKKSPSALRGLIAGLAVIAIGLAAFFLLSPEKTAPKAKTPKKSAVLKEVKPAPAPKAEEPAPEKPEEPKELPPQRVGEIRNGYRLLPSGRLHRVKGEIHVGNRRDTLVDKTFDQGSDRMIAYLLTAEPGGTMVGDSASIMRGFNESFEKSLKEKIVIKPEDDEDVKALKQAVIDARQELLDGMAKGKSAEELMVETREQLRELTLYREDLEREVAKHVEDGMSQKDYEELIGAANLMLEERGSKKVEMPKFVADALEMNYRRKEAELQRKARELEKKLEKEEQE